MREFFIAFRSRSEAISFYGDLSSYGIMAKVINTPSGAGIGCGLSVKLFVRDMQKAKIVLDRGRYRTAVGVYYFSTSGGVIKS